MKLQLSSLFLTGFAACAVASPDNFRPFRFQTAQHYDSRLQLIDSETTVPMVVNKLTDELIRVIPYGSVLLSKDLLEEQQLKEEKELQAEENYADDKNILQIFSADLKHHSHKFIGPSACPTADLGIYYLPEEASSSTASSTPSSISEKAILVSGCPSAVNQLKFPCLNLRCPYQSNQPIVKSITISNGETFILYNDHLDVIDNNCELVRTLPSFDYDVTTWNTAQDMLVDERQNFLIIGFEGFYTALMDPFTLEFYFSAYVIGEPTALPYALILSAMTLPGISYFRFYYDNSTWWTTFNLYDHGSYSCKSVFAAKPRFTVIRDEPMEVKTTETISSVSCGVSSGKPAVFNDYVNNVDIIIGRLLNHATLHIYTTKAVTYGNVIKQCQDLHYSERIQGEPISFTNAKHPNKNSLYLGFSKSLDILHINYDLA